MSFAFKLCLVKSIVDKTIIFPKSNTGLGTYVTWLEFRTCKKPSS